MKIKYFVQSSLFFNRKLLNNEAAVAEQKNARVQIDTDAAKL